MRLLCIIGIALLISGCASIMPCHHIWSAWNNEPCKINGTWYISSARHCERCELVEGKLEEKK